jgi:hypothetical protein
MHQTHAWQTIARRGHAAAFVLALAVFAAVFAANRCQAATRPGPVGHGVLEFGSWAGSPTGDNPQALGLNILYEWRQLEPREGEYNWAPLDEALNNAAAKAMRIAPRVYTNLGDFGQGTPDWVFAAGAASYYAEPGASIRQPVPMDPVFTAKFGRFLEAFGDRYDGHPQIEFIQTNAAMGTYGEMVWGYPESYRPAGWSPDVQVGTTRYWIDRWRLAFPRTPLVIMENFIGHGIAETATDYAVSRGFYLQANDPWHGAESRAILARHGGRTKIVMEVEDRGCRSARGDAFDGMVDHVFSGGYPVDYLTVCRASFEDPARMQRAIDRLRR